MEGVSGRGSSEAEGMVVLGWGLTMTDTSDIKITRSSSVNFCPFVSSRMESRIRRIVPIGRSHTPPKWGAWGWLNSQLHP